MSDSDVLQRAAAALRTAHDGQREGSGFTRARVLATLAEGRRPRRRRWLVAAPLVTVLFVGSAWAQSTGSWGRVWQAVSAVLPFVHPATPSSAPRSKHAPSPAEPRAPEPVESSPPPVPPEPLAPSAPDPVVPAPSGSPHPRAPQPAPHPPRSAPEPPPPATSADPELGAFRSAHELHLRGAARAAIAAYGAYLRTYPRGRFVPEARYNSALDQIKLGDHAGARTALAPFAAGRYGGYRQREARELLEALPR